MKSNIKGFAFEPNEAELYAANRARYKELVEAHPELLKRMKITPAYKKGVFVGTLEGDAELALSGKDIALLADNGNLCFGGYCEISGNRYSGAYYTD